MWGEAEQFRHWIELLAYMGIESFAINLRHHGDSAKIGPLGKATLTDYRLDAEALLAHIESRFSCKKTIIVGHSMGGRICQMVLNNHKDQDHFFSGLRGVILLASAPPPGIFLGWKMARQMARLEYILAMVAGQPFKMVDEDVGKMLCNDEGPDKTFERQVPFNPESGNVALEMVINQHRRREKKLDSEKMKRVKMFYIMPSDDRMVPILAQLATIKHFDIDPKQRVRVIPGEKHMMPLGLHNRSTLTHIVNYAKVAVDEE